MPAGSGRLWLCGKHFIAPDPEAALTEVGASGVVCLNDTAELIPRYPRYVEWLRANRPDRVIWHPVPDLGAPTLAEAVTLLLDIRSRLAVGSSLVAHCGAGMGRAGTVAAGLLVTMGVPVKEAVWRVGAHRPMAGPQSGSQTDLLVALAAVTGEGSPR